jgi:D-alanyl-D-alanine carboxypeptidase
MHRWRTADDERSWTKTATTEGNQVSTGLMRRGMAYVLVAALASGLLAVAVPGQSSSSSAPRIADSSARSVAGTRQPSSTIGVAAQKPTKLQRIARSLVAAGAPGAIVYVRTPNGVRSATAGFARLHPRVPMRAVVHYRIASVTKTFVATVVLQLAGQGKVSLDDPVERWLPGLVPNGAAITVRMLLNHTSGLYDIADDPALLAEFAQNPTRQWTPREVLRFALSQPPLSAPGSSSAYSNTGYILLGLVIEAVTGEPLDQVLGERLVQPLRLRATSFPSGTGLPEPAAHGYELRDGRFIELIYNPSIAWGTGHIVSNVADLSTFFAALLKGRLLPAALLKQMKAGPAPKTGWIAGLGLLTTRTPCGTAYGHGGDIDGWHDEVLATANGRRVAVVMVNYAPARLHGRFAAAPAALCSQ